MTKTRRDLLNEAAANCGNVQPLTATSIHEIDLNVRCGFPDIAMVSHKGESLKFYEDAIANRAFLVNFFSLEDDATHAQTVRLVKVANLLKDRLGRDFYMTSVTVDPDNDTVERLAEWADKHKVPDGWRLVRMKGEDAAVLAQRMFHFNRGASAGMGRLGFYGNGMNGNRVWGTFPIAATPEDAAQRVRCLMPQEKPKFPVRAGPAKASDRVYPWSFRCRV